MSSFELKPMGSTNQNVPGVGATFLRPGAAMAEALPTIEDVVWTANRSPVPPPLADRVPGEVWARTFDAVRSRCAADLERGKETLVKFTGGLPFIPCCVPCIVCRGFSNMSRLQAAALEADRAWLDLAQSEQKTYAAYGVSVTIATEMQMSGAGSNRKLHNAKVGLRFETGPAAAASEYGPPVVVTAEPVSQHMERPDEGLASQLEKLSDLHRKGALTEAEYAAAKTKLLDS